MGVGRLDKGVGRVDKGMMGITKKGNFGGQYNYFNNHFGIDIKNLVTLMDYINIDGTHNY